MCKCKSETKYFYFLGCCLISSVGWVPDCRVIAIVSNNEAPMSSSNALFLGFFATCSCTAALVFAYMKYI